ncbi:MAG: DNA primase [Candidatus Paceibacterota bacterium]
MNSPVEEIKRKIGIEEVVSSYIELKEAGKTLKALCPFHSEKTPSFTISTERQSFYCFGCNRGGDMFTFVEEFEGIDFKGALKILAERAGVDLRQYRSAPENKDAKEKLNRLYLLLDKAKDLYCKTLENTNTAKEYLQKRGVTNESSSRFEIGFAPDAWSYLFEKLTALGFTQEEIEEAGLIIRKESGGHYDRFRNRVMFPIADSTGRIVAFSGRTLDQGSKTAKYINSPETALFKKRDVLYGIDKAKLSVRKFGFSILVEGQMDLVLSHQTGFRNTVATSGTALRGREDEGESGLSNLELIKRISKNIVIAFDSDDAGISATIKNAQLALSLGMDVKVAVLPPGSDPADVVLDDSRKWKKIIKESKDAVEFQLSIIQSKSKDKKAVLKSVQQELFETIDSIPSKIDQEHYLTVVSESIGISEETLSDEFKNFKGKQERLKKEFSKKKVFTKEQETAFISDERLMLASLLGVYARNPENDSSTLEGFEKDFSEIYSKTSKEVVATADLRKREKYVYEIEEDNQTVLEVKNLIEYLLNRVRIRELEKKAALLLSHLRNAEESADKETAANIFSEYSSLLKNIEVLKQSHES